ncbi:MAG: outer membrane beta-barrel protein [Ferruginibacter sp.]
MRKLFVVALAFLATVPAFSQEKSDKKKIDINKAGDHIMLQLGLNSLIGAPDTISSHIKGFQRSANVYLMFNKPFRGNPKMSIAFGAGIGTSNLYFKKMIVDIGASSSTLPFTSVDSAQNYKKFKLATTFLEAPLEIRYTAYPETPNKGLKLAAGIKVGTLLNAHTKAKTLRTASDATINNNTIKVASKDYFNSTRLTGTLRAGYGNFTIFGAYSFTSMFKDGVAENMNLLQVGLCISGL